MTPPNPQVKVTDSWNAYQEFMGRIHEFLEAFRVEGSEVWFGDVCFGSPREPWLRLPVRRDSVPLLDQSIELAERHASAVEGSLRASIETSKRVIEELGGTIGDRAKLDAIVERIKSLERLLAELKEAVASHPVRYHPAVLIKWRGILEDSFHPGDPRVLVRVEVVYQL